MILTTAKRSKMKLNSIQFLRGVAALLVVYEHSMDVQEKFSISTQQKLFHLDNFGCIGVDLFFVISGFIITYIANKYNGPEQSLNFLAKRFYRINPIYYIATLFCLAICFLRLEMTHQSTQSSLKGVALQLSDSILILPTSDNVNSFLPLLTVGWTLAFEWLFYILFFFLILFNAKRKVLCLLSVIGCLVLIGRLTRFDDLRLIFLTNPIMLEFLLGLIICYFYLYAKRIPAFIGSILLISGLVAYISMIIFGFGYIWHYQLILSGDQSLHRFLYWGIPSSLIVAGSVILEKNGILTLLWSNKISILTGNASYSIYLVHYTVLDLFKLLYLKKGFLIQPDVMIWFQLIIAVAISIVFYKLVETPLLQYINRRSIWNTLFPEKIKVTGTQSKLFEPVSV